MFNIKSFRAALAALTGARDERAADMARFISGAAHDAAVEHLLNGSDSINQFLDAIFASGKGSIAAKFRKAIRTADHDALASWGKVSCTNKAFSFTKAANYIGGNSTKCTDKIARDTACAAWAHQIEMATLQVFAPPATGEKAGPWDFLKLSDKGLAAKIAASDLSALYQARSALADLDNMLLTAMEAIEKNEDEEDETPVAETPVAETKPRKSRAKKEAVAA